MQADLAVNPETTDALNRLSRRLLLIFIVPLIVIALLVTYTIYLNIRIGKLERQASTLSALEDASVVERYFDREHNIAWTIDQFEKIVVRNPTAATITRLAGFYINRASEGDIKRAHALLEKAEKLDPQYWEAPSLIAFLYLSEGKENEAIQYGERAISLNKFDAATLNNLAWLHATGKTVQDLNIAVEYATRAVTYTKSQNATFLDTLAEVEFRRGDNTLAANTIEKAIRHVGLQLTYLESQREKFRSGVK